MHWVKHIGFVGCCGDGDPLWFAFMEKRMKQQPQWRQQQQQQQNNIKRGEKCSEPSNKQLFLFSNYYYSSQVKSTVHTSIYGWKRVCAIEIS